MGASLSAENATLRLRLEELGKQLEERDKKVESIARVAFMNLLQGMCGSSSSESESDLDTARRGVSPPEQFDDETILGDVIVDASVTTNGWATFCASCAAWKPPAATATLNERNHVHPIVERLLLAAASVAPSQRLRVWCGKTAVDDIKSANIIPDFSVTPAGEGQVALINTVFFVEVKLPGNLKAGARQAASYCRRAIRVLLNEAIERNDRVDNISALAVATDGLSIMLVRVWSGAPPLGQSWENCNPCPSEESRVFRLLPVNWNFYSPPTLSLLEPLPEGFELLVRLFHASDDQLGLAARLPLTSATLQNRDSKEVRRFDLDLRLGCGGSSDVYSIRGNDEYVLKIARMASESVATCYVVEADCLEAFADSGCQHLPRLIFVGARIFSSARPSGYAPPNAIDWPAMCIAPKGVLLSDWVERQQTTSASVHASESASASSPRQPVRVKCADEMLSHLLLALSVAHSKGLFHCDIRPRNIVVVPCAAPSSEDGVQAASYVLVDWGLARRSRGECAGRGVSAYAPAATLQQTSCKARAALDLEAAVYTWLAVVYGNHRCDAPWIEPAQYAREELGIRDEWLTNKGASDFFVKRAATAVKALQKHKGTTKAALSFACATDFWNRLAVEIDPALTVDESHA